MSALSTPNEWAFGVAAGCMTQVLRLTEIKARFPLSRQDEALTREDPAMAASTLVAYYSMTGRTRAIAKEIGRATGADIEEIREPRMREGVPGLWRALLDALARRRTPILSPHRDPAHYDLVIIGGPIWAGRMGSPVRAFAKQYLGQARQVAFFCTAGGPKADEAFADLQRLCGHVPSATWLVDAKHLEVELHRAEFAHFLAQATRSVRADQAGSIAQTGIRLA